MFDITQKTSDYMSIILTHECNKKCPFCVDQYRGQQEYISAENVDRALAFAKRSSVKDILLIGGEPTLHPNVVEIAKKVKLSGFRLIMTTNYTKPEIVKQLDGIVDCFNISFYNQRTLPKQSDFVSDLTLHTLIHDKQLATKDKLDEFIDSHRCNGHLKFSTLETCNDWAKKHQNVGYIDYLEGETVLLFNEIEGLIYRGAVIKRYDRLVNPSAVQSFKAHVDGVISNSWNRG